MKVRLVSKVVLLFAFAVMVVSQGAFAAQPAAGLTPELIKELQASFKTDAGTRALMNAITNNDVKSLALNRELYNGYDDLFNYKIDAKGITDQQKSGRCWLFAGLNIMRPAVIKKYNLTEFELSQNHLFFWDKLEKANMFLEAVIETRERPLDDRELEVLLKDPVPDGGWWTYVVSLVEKYGAVPKEVMPETNNSNNTGMLNLLLNRLMRHDAAELRGLAAAGKKVPALEARRVEMLKDVYRLLALNLGTPPQEFVWRYEDKDNKVHEASYTPLTFYSDVVGVKLGDYVTVFDHPAHPYNKYYRIKYCRNMPDIPDMDFVNLDVKSLRQFALKSLLAGEPTWFAADVGKQNDGKDGIFEDGIYDYRSLFGMDITLTKAERVQYFDSSPNHAMVFVGVDTLGARPLKWLVENSWGTDAGNKGLWTMYDNWFDEYVYGVIVNKKFLPAEVLALLETKPEVLPAWDPMRELFK
jgi:bleomycin hydrolase